MRLLDKRELEQKENQERKRDIDEGVKLAKKIDGLRKLEAEETKRITEWRNSQLVNTQREIESAVRTLNGIKSEIASLERKREELKKPLDEEWTALRKSQEEQKQRDAELDRRELETVSQAKITSETLAEAKRQKDRAGITYREALQKEEEADSSLKLAHEQSADMRRKAQIVLSRAELTEKLSEERELKVAIRERDAQNKQENNEKYAHRLFIKEQELKDGWKTLLATKKELNA